MNFATIQTKVKDYLLDLPDETELLVPEWINFVIREAEDDHNFRYMEAVEQYPTVEGNRDLGLKPDRWKDFRGYPYLIRDDGGTSEIDWAASLSDMVRQYSDDPDVDKGAPQFLLQSEDSFDVYPYPDGQSDYTDGEYVLDVPYWRYSAELTADVDTNWLTDNYPWYVIFAAVSKGLVFNRDEQRAAGYVGMATDQYRRAVRKDKRSRLPDRMSLSVRPRVYGPGRQPRGSRSRWR